MMEDIIGFHVSRNSFEPTKGRCLSAPSLLTSPHAVASASRLHVLPGDRLFHLTSVTIDRVTLLHWNSQRKYSYSVCSLHGTKFSKLEIAVDCRLVTY